MNFLYPTNVHTSYSSVILITLQQKLLQCLPKVRETGVQSLLESYQRLKKWYLMLPCLTLSIKRYGSRVKWSNPRKGVAPFPTPQCSSYWKGSARVTLNYGRQLIVKWDLSLQTRYREAYHNIWKDMGNFWLPQIKIIHIYWTIHWI